MILPCNKKIDWKALPQPGSIHAANNARYIAPQNAMERQQVSIWEAVMKISSLGVIESFFNFGGHSPRVPEIVSRIVSVWY